MPDRLDFSQIADDMLKSTPTDAEPQIAPGSMQSWMQPASPLAPPAPPSTPSQPNLPAALQQAANPSTFAYNASAPSAPIEGPQTSPLVAALAALGRLGGNIAGIATGKGPAGEMLKSEAEGYADQLYREKAHKTKALQDFEDRMQQYRDKEKQAKSIWTAAEKNVSDPKIRSSIQYMAANGMEKEALHLMTADQMAAKREQISLDMAQKKMGLRDADRDRVEKMWKLPGFNPLDTNSVMDAALKVGFKPKELDELVPKIQEMYTEKKGGFLGFGGEQQLNPLGQMHQQAKQDRSQAAGQILQGDIPPAPGFKLQRNTKGEVAWRNPETGEIRPYAKR